MNKKYCKLKNSDKIYTICNINGNCIRIKSRNITVNTNIDNVIFVDKPLQEKQTNNSYTIITDSEIDNNCTPEIMLRHKTKLDAINELDKFIDTAIVNRLPQIKIIHGKSGGVLRQAVHEFLDRHQYVLSYEYGQVYQGSYGVTIAKIGKR